MLTIRSIREKQAPRLAKTFFITMSTDIHPDPATSELSEAAGKIGRRAADAARETARTATDAARNLAGTVEDVAGDVADATRDAANRATETAKEMYQSAALRAGDALATSENYVRRNPVPVVLGAIAFGAALGYLLLAPRRKPTFSERYSDEPLAAVREAILEALAPVTQRVHKGYDSARDGAGRVMDRVHHAGSGHAVESISDQIGRIGSHLKFW